jgi:hypothetical protein
MKSSISASLIAWAAWSMSNHHGPLEVGDGAGCCVQTLERLNSPGNGGSGTVNLSGRVTRMQASGSGHWGLLPTHVTDFGPDLKFLGPRSSMLCGSDVIAAEVEKVIDLIVG